MSVSVWADDGDDIRTMLGEIIEGIQDVPIILGVFLGAGIATALFPVLRGAALTIAISIGVLLFYKEYNEEVPTESLLVWRLFKALIAATLVTLLLLFGLLLLPVGILLIVLWLYTYSRLFLVIPNIMIEGDGLVEAFTKSWNALDGSALAISCLVVLAFLFTFIAASPVFLFVESGRFVTVAINLFLGVPIAGFQAVVYSKVSAES